MSEWTWPSCCMGIAAGGCCTCPTPDAGLGSAVDEMALERARAATAWVKEWGVCLTAEEARDGWLIVSGRAPQALSEPEVPGHE